MNVWYIALWVFQSTLPTRGSDATALAVGACSGGFNPRSPRGGATLYSATFRPRKSVSIHAPHEGERHIGDAYVWGAQGVSIHAPHEGERRQPRFGCCFGYIVSIHAPHEGERPACKKRFGGPKKFQSTLPTRGSDLGAGAALHCRPLFQSTLPTRGSDAAHIAPTCWRQPVSIHAPHEGERLSSMLNPSFAI